MSNRTKRNYSISLDDAAIKKLRDLSSDTGWTKSAVIQHLIGVASADDLLANQRKRLS